VREPDLLVGSTEVQLLRRGAEAFPAMLAAIAGAQSHVHLETYILRSDTTGKQFQAALIERARAGVQVRLLFDSVGSFSLVSNDYLSELAQAGVEILEYHPITPWRRSLLLRLRALRASADARRGRPPRTYQWREPGHWNFNRRDHQKILVIDDEVAFTGGLNIGDEYAPAPQGGDWYDLHVLVRGPAACGLAESFRRAWLDAGGTLSATCPVPPKVEATPALAHTCDNFGMRSRSRMHSAYRHAIRNAERTIDIMNAYFIPDQLLRWALGSAARRGVSVRVMVPLQSDVRPVWYASRYLFARLLRSGVRIFEYQGRMMHAKAGVIDGVWTTIGSFNIDRRSMLHNLEAGVVVVDRPFARTLQDEFEIRLALCREISLADWRKRSLVQRFLEWFAYLFAHWL
jgi:cardiolipin synthase A/B